MPQAKKHRKNDGRWPEADPISEGKERVTAQQIFFGEPYQQEPYKLLCSPSHDCCAIYGEVTEVEYMQEPQHKEAD